MKHGFTACGERSLVKRFVDCNFNICITIWCLEVTIIRELALPFVKAGGPIFSRGAVIKKKKKKYQTYLNCVALTLKILLLVFLLGAAELSLVHYLTFPLLGSQYP